VHPQSFNATTHVIHVDPRVRVFHAQVCELFLKQLYLCQSLNLVKSANSSLGELLLADFTGSREQHNYTV
jgi:hypothetical protein